MDWKTWTKLSGIILFAIAVSNFYLGNFYSEGVVLSIENFPGKFDLDTTSMSENITFSFFLYNTGSTSAFVDNILISNLYGTRSTQGHILINPVENFIVEPGFSKEIFVTLPAPDQIFEGEVALVVYYDNDKAIHSPSIPVKWGSLL
jgi:hypothetical protein